MKYIGNAFSPAMIKGDEGDVLIEIKTITKRQFLRAGNHAKSIIGHPEVADLFGLPLNRETVYLRKGDMLYVVLPRKRYREGESVRYGDRYEFIPEESEFTFKQIQVLER